MKSPALEKVALTYANDVRMDGAGAQLQRIYGIYALSRFLHLPYIHSPLKRISNQGLAAIESNRPVENLESKYNEVFSLPSDMELPGQARVHYLENPTLEEIEAIRQVARNADEFHLIRLLLPYAITDQNTEIYGCLKEISPFKREDRSVFKVGIHIRRGDVMIAEAEAERRLPNSYYVATALNLIACLEKMKIEYECEIYTEVPSTKFVVKPDNKILDTPIASEVVVDPEALSLKDFEIIPHLAKIENLEPVETLRRMATSDALIISKSSFSYLAGVFNATGIVIYHPFWHNPLKDWLISDSNGILPKKELKKRLKPWRKIGWPWSWLKKTQGDELK